MWKLMIAATLSAALLAPFAASPAFAATEPTPGQLAMRERQKKCAAEWKQLKADGKVQPGMTWPKFWSECNKRLKAQPQ